MVTREELRAYLTQHRNWVEIAPGRFEACIESDIWPVRIELDEAGVVFTFPRKASGCWAFLAGKSRRAAYQRIHIDDLSGCLMIDIQAAILPSGHKPESDRANDTQARISYQIKLPPNLPDSNPAPDISDPN